MSISQIDRRSALVIIDLQHGIVALDTCHPISAIIDNCCQLITLFRQLSLPIVLVNVDDSAPGRTDITTENSPKPANWSHLFDKLKPHKQDILITKKC